MEKFRLTKEVFEDTPYDTIITKGIARDNSEGINMTNSGKLLKWIAKKGSGNDWAIYTYWEEASDHYVLAYGDKVRDINNIKNILDVDEYVMDRYRF